VSVAVACTKTTQAIAGTALSKAGDTLNVSGVSGTEINLSDIAGNNLTVDAVNDELDASATGGSAIEAQEDGVQLSTDTTLIDWQDGLTATNPSGDDININVDESEVDHDSLNQFVSNEHVDHSSVSISAGDGLSGGGDITASRTLTAQSVQSISSNTTASAQNVLLADASGSALTVTLPSPSTDVNVTVKKTDSSGNAVTIATPGGQTIDGQSSISITAQYASRTVVSDGNNYFIT